MFRSYCRSGCAIAFVISVLIAAPHASATLISFSGTSSDGHVVAGEALFTPSAGTVTVKLTNTTGTTLDAGELFTGLDFSLGGLTPSLTSKLGIERTVTGSGSFSDTGAAQNLSWSLASLGSGNYQLNFNPDAKDAIIGPPSGGNYAGANGSIKGNGGHNPFAAETATFVLDAPGATANTSATVTTFRYGTSLDPASGTTIINVPEPASCMIVMIGAVCSACKRRGQTALLACG